MAPGQTAKKEKTSGKKEKIFHPSSRKAGQLVRVSLRKEKLQSQATKRKQEHGSKADVYGFFYHSLPEEGVLSLQELHDIIRSVWLARYDQELNAEQAARRKGRPKSTRELQLEDLKLREAEIYRTGMEVIDLTHKPTVELFRKWDQKEVAYIDPLRFIRISSPNPDRFIVSRPGKHITIIGASKEDGGADSAMDMDEALPT